MTTTIYRRPPPSQPDSSLAYKRGQIDGIASHEALVNEELRRILNQHKDNPKALIEEIEAFIQ